MATDQNEEPILAAGLLKRAHKLFQTLRDVGTQRDGAGNRKLLFSHYAGLVLLGFFNPTMQSLAGMQRASELRRVREALGCRRTSRGSLSESVTVFDPGFLEPIIRQLIDDLPADHPGPRPQRHIPESILHELARRLMAFDGSSLRALPQIVSMAARARGAGQWQLHLHFRPLSGQPGPAVVTRDQVQGEGDERDVLADTLEPGNVYIADRGLERYSLLEAIVQAGSDYVIRAQERSIDILEQRTLTTEARQARVVSDELVRLNPSTKTSGVSHTGRRITIKKQGQQRQRSDRRKSDTVILLTNLLDVPAEVIAAIYELRWTIELFFRFLKQVLSCRRLLSNKPQGVAIQVYVALIACLLLAGETGGNASRELVDLMSMYLSGWADEAELQAAIARHRSEQEAQRARRSR